MMQPLSGLPCVSSLWLRTRQAQSIRAAAHTRLHTQLHTQLNSPRAICCRNKNFSFTDNHTDYIKAQLRQACLEHAGGRWLTAAPPAGPLQLRTGPHFARLQLPSAVPRRPPIGAPAPRFSWSGVHLGQA